MPCAKRQIRCASPHSHSASRIGISDRPRSDRRYSTLGGICGYSVLMAAEGADKDKFEPVLHYYYEALLRHMGWKNLGTALAGGVLAVGDILGKPALEEARQLGPPF